VHPTPTVAAETVRSNSSILSLCRRAQKVSWLIVLYTYKSLKSCVHEHSLHATKQQFQSGIKLIYANIRIGSINRRTNSVQVTRDRVSKTRGSDYSPANSVTAVYGDYVFVCV